MDAVMINGTLRIDGADQWMTYDEAKRTWQQTLRVHGSVALLEKGAVLTIDGVRAMKQTREGVEHAFFAQQFVVIEEGTNEGRKGWITVTPPIIIDGPFQTVSQAPADGAGFTLHGFAPSAEAQ